jgi:hypothetical protein
MPTAITNFRLPTPLLERIDAARGQESRTSWLKRAAESQLAVTAGADASSEAPRRSAASSADAKAGVTPR